MTSAPVRPPRLRPGDTVAVVSTSWGGPSVFPGVFGRGVDVLRRVFGLQVREMSTTRMLPEELIADPRRRADELNAAFADSSVAAIFMSIGGIDSVRILPFLDPALARASPKILLGFSDSTTQTTFYNQAGLVTFNGPSVMAGFAQIEAFPDAVSHVRSVLFEPSASLEYAPFGEWVGGYPSWTDPANAGAVAERQAHDGWRWLQGSARVEGRLFGGCADVLEMMKSTAFWPSASFWDGRLLFLETSEDVPPPDQVSNWLRNYGMQGVFDRVAALLIGRPRGYDDASTARLDELAVKVVAGEFGRPDLPIVSGLDFGHTDPQWVLPLGVLASVDPVVRSIRLEEPAVT
ncbi:MAG TPA: S66 peptidase family protein [Candidatus Limnocylindrales bacterium]|nr:S66 peptidase family protein [Candidatus Limnocylindrales bacterium]